MGDEDFVAKPSQHFVTEDKLGLMGIDVGNGLPRTVIEENAASDDGVDVRVHLNKVR